MRFKSFKIIEIDSGILIRHKTKIGDILFYAILISLSLFLVLTPFFVSYFNGIDISKLYLILPGLITLGSILFLIIKRMSFLLKVENGHLSFRNQFRKWIMIPDLQTVKIEKGFTTNRDSDVGLKNFYSNIVPKYLK